VLLKQPAAFTREEGAKAMTELLALAQPPDAVFCFSDVLAIGAMRAIHDHGLRVPHDVAVVGFDDIAEGRFSVPSLSTISPQKDQLGELAVGLLERRLGDNGSGFPAEEVEVNFTLKVRESTQPDERLRSTDDR
ncbi:MAG TPA: substrate-binding domain-containing protein, partial [Acidothermaceae bacterium]